jgi:signal transduction histidine kinase
MFRFPLLTLACALSACASALAETPSLRSAAALTAFVEQAETGQTAAFDLTGVVYHARAQSILFKDASGRIMVHDRARETGPKPGDLVNLKGNTRMTRDGEPWTYAAQCTVLGHGPIPPPLEIRLTQLDERQHALTDILVEGTVMRTFDDDIDENNLFLQIKDEEAIVPVTLKPEEGFNPENLVDAVVRVRGIYHRNVNGLRKFSGPYIDAESYRNLTVVTPPPANPFDAPPLLNRLYLTPREIARLGRRTVRGRVIATWGGNRMMLREDSGRTVNVELSKGEKLAHCGSRGTAAGYTETDLYRISLVSAIFKPEVADPAQDEEPSDTSFDSLRPGHSLGFDLTLLHGKLIRVRGILRSIPAEGAAEQKMILDCGKMAIAVDFSSNPTAVGDLLLGSGLEITGRCLVECERGRADNFLPRIKDVTVILRTPDDIRVLSHPPWWTTERLLAVIGILLASLLAFLVWNRILRRLVDRRSRELFRSKAKNMEAEVRLSERTRLAADLHDTISQMLTGASMRVDAARDFLETDANKAQKCLGIAAKTLASCKNDLRSCIWDLRNRVLDEDKIEEAIRKTVQPILGKTDLTVHFDVRRNRVSDNVLHALLCIIRELVSNAIRHGKASAIAVTGALSENTLLFSVQDDGVGFDPDNRPGLAEGHFGLLGITERLRQLGGDMKIESSPKTGTKIKLWIRLQS